MAVERQHGLELFISPPENQDPDWRDKIALARREREAARKARKGKPVTLSRPDVRPRSDRNNGKSRYSS